MKSGQHTVMNDFEIDLQYSIEERDNQDLNNFYKRIFPDLTKIEFAYDLELQKKGIDKILHFKNGKTVLIDEKKRRKDYGDILLEEYSNYEEKIWGWLNREKHTDYLIYYIVPTSKIYIFPFLILQLTWLRNYKKWLENYGRKFAINKNYKTSNIPIPTEILLKEISTTINQNNPQPT